ncbi:MAG: hypothetical protein JO326_03230, partial [Acetobacteraceae bacterium]|nr:hypothetical protein [Acetobacteraceae bacterium]
MNRLLRRGALISAGLHLAIIAALVIGITSSPAPDDAPQTVDVELADAPGPVQQAMLADQPGPVPAPDVKPTPTPAPMATEEPKPLPL